MYAEEDLVPKLQDREIQRRIDENPEYKLYRLQKENLGVPDNKLQDWSEDGHLYVAKELNIRREACSRKMELLKENLLLLQILLRA